MNTLFCSLAVTLPVPLNTAQFSENQNLSWKSDHNGVQKSEAKSSHLGCEEKNQDWPC